MNAIHRLHYISSCSYYHTLYELLFGYQLQPRLILTFQQTRSIQLKRKIFVYIESFCSVQFCICFFFFCVLLCTFSIQSFVFRFSFRSFEFFHFIFLFCSRGSYIDALSTKSNKLSFV